MGIEIPRGVETHVIINRCISVCGSAGGPSRYFLENIVFLQVPTGTRPGPPLLTYMQYPIPPHSVPLPSGSERRICSKRHGLIRRNVGTWLGEIWCYRSPPYLTSLHLEKKKGRMYALRHRIRIRAIDMSVRDNPPRPLNGPETGPPSRQGAWMHMAAAGAISSFAFVGNEMGRHGRRWIYII